LLVVERLGLDVDPGAVLDGVHVSTLFVVSPYLSNETAPVAPVKFTVATAPSTPARVGAAPPVVEALTDSMIAHAAS